MPIRGKPKRLAADPLWEFALKTLDRRAYAAAELRRKLSLRAETKSDLDQVMKKLQKYGLLDDARFAESFAASRLEGQGFGARRVLRDLRSRSVGTQAAEAAVQRVYSEVEETELAGKFLQRKFRSKNLPDYLKEEKNLAAAYRRLLTAGFSTAASIKVLKQFAQRAEELESMETDNPEDER
jgi:regulatory protein